MYLVSFVFTQT